MQQQHGPEGVRGVFGGPLGMGPMDDNDRVNRMNEQEFADHMNELFLRDNKKPLKQGFLSTLPTQRYKKSEEENKEADGDIAME